MMSPPLKSSLPPYPLILTVCLSPSPPLSVCLCLSLPQALAERDATLDTLQRKRGHRDLFGDQSTGLDPCSNTHKRLVQDLQAMQRVREWTLRLDGVEAARSHNR